MATLTRDQIKAELEKAPRIETVWIEEWQADALIRVMTGKQRDAYEAEITGSKVSKGAKTINLVNIRARLVARCLCDESGKLLYNCHIPADIEELGAIDARILNEIAKVASELNGITEKDVEELEKTCQRWRTSKLV